MYKLLVGCNGRHIEGMYNSFAETGVFILACHHGMGWTISDMMWSGKLCVSICLLFLLTLQVQNILGYNFSVVGGIAARPGNWAMMLLAHFQLPS